MAEKTAPMNSLTEELPRGASPDAYADRLEVELQEILEGPSRDNELAYRRWLQRSFAPSLRRELHAADTERAIVDSHRDFRCSLEGEADGSAATLNRADVARALRTILLHHASWLIRDPEQYAPESIPDQAELELRTEEARALQWKSVTRAVIWVLSAVTSFTGTTHLAGWLLTPLMFGVVWLEPWRWHLRMALALVLAAGISHMVLLVKREIEHRMLEGVPGEVDERYSSNEHGQLSAAGACLHALQRDRSGRSRKLIALPAVLLAVGVLFADAATNITGVFSFFGSYQDHTNQIEERKAEVSARLDGLRAELEGLPDELAGKASKEVDRLLLEEEGGLSVTQETGRGMMYWSKSLLLKDDYASFTELSAIEPGPGSCSELQDTLMSDIQASGLMGSAGLTEGVHQLTATKTAGIHGSLQEIQDRMLTLSPGDAIETLQRELDATNAIFVATVEQLNEALPSELEAHLNSYDAVLAGMADASLSSGCFTKAAPAGMNGLQFEPVDVDTSPIELTPMVFRSPLEMLGVVLSLPLYKALPILLFAPFAGFFLSHLDALFLRRTRELFTRDYEAIQAAEAQQMQWLGCTAAVLARVLSEGPCSAFFKGEDDLIETEGVFDALCQEVSSGEPTSAAGLRGTVREQARGDAPWDRLRAWWVHVDTPIVQAHNRRVDRVHDLYTQPERLRPVMNAVLPGLEKLERIGEFVPGMRRHYPDRRWIKRIVRRELNSRAFVGEAPRLRELEARMGELEDTLEWEWLELLGDPASQGEEIRASRGALEKLEASLRLVGGESPQSREYLQNLQERAREVRYLLGARERRLAADATTHPQLSMSAV